MLLRSSALWAPKTLAQMFRKLKLAGAHPDVLWAIDGAKSQHNGEEMIRLETLMHEREVRLRGRGDGGGGGGGGATPRSNKPQHFLFWLKANPHAATASPSSAQLKAVRCTITPFSESRIVKQQLTQLFTDAGVLEEFSIASDGKEASLESVLQYADERQMEHLHQSGPLYVRSEKAIENLRRFGVLLVVEEDGDSYLVSLPEMEPSGQVSNHQAERIGSSPHLQSLAGSTQAPYMPAKSIIGPNGEIDAAAREFMTERGMRPFDLRMAGSHSSVERFVGAFERLERMYEVHRGRALRASVCLVLSLRSTDNYIAPDGCLVLAVQRMPTWEEFLLSIPQAVWQDCVRKHLDWRVGNAPKLQERRRKLARVSSMFGFHRVTMEAPVGGRLQWQEELLERFSKEEPMIQRAVRKHGLMSDLLRKRGEMRFVERLYSSGTTADRTEIGFRIGGDGTVVFNYRVMNTGQILRVLKDNLRRMEVLHRKHEDAVKTLEHLSRHVPLDFSVDTAWKLKEGGNLVNCLDRFVRTIKQNEQHLSAFLHRLMAGGGGESDKGGATLPAAVLAKKRMVWVISDRLDTMPSGVVFVPYDIDFESIKKHLLTAR